MADRHHCFHYIGVQAKAIARLAPKVHRTFGRKSVHELRVATRRARTALWMIKHSSVPTRFTKLEAELKTLGTALGEVRELDVALHDAKRFRMNPSSIKDRGKSARKHLLKLSGKTRMARLGRRFSVAEKSLMKAGVISFRRPNEILKLKLEEHLRHSARGKGGRHELRITLKKVRYTLEALGKPVAPLKRVIKVLGDAHDLELLQVLLHKKRKANTERTALNAEATELALPALNFAVTQLESLPHLT